MARQAFWKGYLKLSLVTCAVAMTPAVSGSEQIRFHTLNRKTGHRVQSRYVDTGTGKPVADEDEARGYEAAEGKLIVLTDKELDAVALESTRTIDIEMFVPRRSIPWIWYDRPHYLVPNDRVGEEAFAVIREAMAATDMAGIARLVLYRREHAVMLEPRGKGLILWTLRYGDEVRDADDYFAGIDAGKPDTKSLKLMRAAMAGQTVDWSDKLVQDQLQERLRRLIARRRKSAKPAAESTRGKPSGNVISIMDALRKSLASESRKKR